MRGDVPQDGPEDGQRGVRHVVVADPGARGALDAVIGPLDAVVSVLGPTGRGPSTACTDVVGSALASMARTGARRLIVVSAHGAAESRDRSPYCLALWAVEAHKMRDKESMEELVRASGVEWTVVRPPALKDGAPTGRYRTGEDLRITLTSSITRADLADFLVHEAAAGAFVHRTPRIAA
ncbi:SDR family oxidoreductase [Kineococcus gypseus]